MEFKLIENKEPFCGICFLNAGNKKTVCLNENHFNQNKLFFIFTLILFYENNVDGNFRWQYKDLVACL